MDAAALQKYKFLQKLGLFPLDPHSRAGAAHFLRIAAGILSLPHATLWITPEGRFTDPRTRPTVLRPGIAHLARLVPRATFLPLALEYTFWNQRRPELLASFGPAVSIDPSAAPADIAHTLAAALEEQQTLLAAAALSRDPGRFTTLLTGAGGVHRVYDTFRKLIATVQGQSFTPNHEQGP